MDNTKIVTLEKEIANKATVIDHIKLTAKNANRNFTDEESIQLNKLLDEVESARKQIELEKRIDASNSGVNNTTGDDQKNDLSKASGFDYTDDRKYTLGEFMQDVAKTAFRQKNGDTVLPTGLQKHQKKWSHEYKLANGVTEGIPTEAGFSVGTDFATTLFEKAYSPDSVPGMCQQVTISKNSNGITIPGVDETSRADGYRWGGIRSYFVGEGDSVEKSKAKLYQVDLKLGKMMTEVAISNEAIEDTTLMETFYLPRMQDEIKFTLTDAVINGDGSAGKPLGILKGNCLISVAAETGQDADTIVGENVIKVYANLWGDCRSRAVWLANDETLEQMINLQSANFPNVPMFLPNGASLVGAPYDRLMGKQIIWLEQMPKLGDAGDLTLVDMSQYVLASKGNIQTASSMHIYFLTDEMAFRCVYRVAGAPMWKSTITPKNANTGVKRAPFVTIAAR